jgi:hypothetical protein
LHRFKIKVKVEAKVEEVAPFGQTLEKPTNYTKGHEGKKVEVKVENFLPQRTPGSQRVTGYS